MSKTGKIFAIKRLEIHDGPGVRTTLFLKGCPLRCLWCHNPEGMHSEPTLLHYAHKCIDCGACTVACPTGAHRIDDGKHLFLREKCIGCGACETVCPANANKCYGEDVTATEILPELLFDKPFYDETGGGVTLSGGEPLAQPEFLYELLTLLRREGVHTAIDTSLAVPESSLLKVVGLADLFLCDIKAVDADMHERLTGRRPDRIFSNLRFLCDRHVPVEIRIPYVPGQNDTQIPRIAEKITELPNVTKVKALAYHDFARTKYEALGKPYPLPDTACPSPEKLARVQAILDEALRIAHGEIAFDGDAEKSDEQAT